MADTHIAFLHGRNIFGAGSTTNEAIRKRLSSLSPRATLRAVIGQSGNLVLTTESLGEQGLREELERFLSEGGAQVRSVVIAAPTLRSVLSQTERHVRTPKDPDWEFGLVLASEEVPRELTGNAGLFPPSDRAIALEVLERRALLVKKRRTTTSGVRIPWGDAVNGPWERHLKAQSVSVHCLTSRSLKRVKEIALAAEKTQSEVMSRAGQEFVTTVASSSQVPSAPSPIEWLVQVAAKTKIRPLVEPLIRALEDGNLVAAWVEARKTAHVLAGEACKAARLPISSGKLLDLCHEIEKHKLLGTKSIVFLHTIRKAGNLAAHEDPGRDLNSRDPLVIAELIAEILRDGHQTTHSRGSLW